MTRKFTKVVISLVLTLAIVLSFSKPAVTEAASIAAPKNLKITTTGDNKAQLKWSAVKDAVGYKIYRKNSSSKNYVEVKSTKSTKYIDANNRAKEGTTVSYYVVAYKKSGNKTITSKKSSVKKWTVPADKLASVPINDKSFPDSKFRNYIKVTFDTNSDGELNDKELRNATVINVSDSRIESVQGIEYLPFLEELYCSKNFLTSIDVYDNKNLKVLDCSMNNISKLEVYTNAELVTLKCYENDISTFTVSELPKLETLWCYDNKIGRLDVTNNRELRSLRCQANSFTRIDLSANLSLEDLKVDPSTYVTRAK